MQSVIINKSYETKQHNKIHIVYINNKPNNKLKHLGDWKRLGIP